MHVDERTVARVMRQTLRDQCFPSFIPYAHEISRYILENALLKETFWPGFVVRCTEEGSAFLARVEGQTDVD